MSKLFRLWPAAVELKLFALPLAGSSVMQNWEPLPDFGPV
jgi:hypothetical protein